jgi:O-antigen biosynthesis alpha-1,3-rhamnosyltransferase
VHRPTSAGAGAILRATTPGKAWSAVYHAAPPVTACLVLRVGLNTSALASPRTGIGNYVVHLAGALAERDDVEVHAFDGRRWSRGLPAASQASMTSPMAGLRAALKPLVPFKRQLRHAMQRGPFARGAREHSLDLYHEPNYVPVPSDIPVVATVHDLSWIRHPDMHPVDRVRWLERSMTHAIVHAAGILVDSEFTRSEVVAEFRCPVERVHVAHLGVAPRFHPRSVHETRATLGAFGLVHAGYVLSVGTIEPRKNIGHTLDAYALLPAALRTRYPLVVAGARGWRAGPIEARLRSLDAAGVLRYVGTVEQDVLADLYAGAAAFVFASLYEGFGLPPLEAMASGVPVLASNRASIPEVTGDAAVLIDPADPRQTSGRLATLLEDATLRAELGERGLLRSRAFTWSACAARTVAAYRAALEAVRR